MNKSQGYADVRCHRCGKTVRTSRLVNRRFMPRGWILREAQLGTWLTLVKVCTKCKTDK